MKSLTLHDVWFVLAGAISTIIIVGIFFSPLTIAWRNPTASDLKVVTADVDGLIRAHTLALASMDQDKDTLPEVADAWRGELISSLETFARQNNLIILPAGAGIFGAQDITGQLKKVLPVLSGGQP